MNPLTFYSCVMLFKYKLIFWSLLISFCCQAQSLSVSRSIGLRQVTTTGSIDEAQFTITPRGIYLEVGMYLTLSAKDANYINWANDFIDFEKPEYDLESRLWFSLPNEAMVTDSWLWVNEDLIQADIEERWSATQTYQELVGFQVDPSLLTKDTWYGSDKSYYNLNVFPLQGDSTRRIKLTYLTPGKWSQGKVSINLPMEILAASKTPVEHISVQCFLEDGFSKPTALQFPNRTFSIDNHATLGEFSQMLFTSTDIVNGVDISFDVQMEDGVFLSTYNNDAEQFFQMAILPTDILLEANSSNEKVLFLIDYDSSKTTFSKEVVLENLKNQIKDNLNTGDLFNLVFVGQNGLEFINEGWMNVSDALIDNVFILLEEAYTLSDETHLPQLLEAGLTFFQEGAEGGTLFLLSCADNLANEGVANTYIGDLTTTFPDSSIAIIIADYQNKNQQVYYYEEIITDEDGHLYYKDTQLYGNEYFYLALNELFFGSTYVIREQRSLINLFNSALDAINPIQNIAEIEIKSGAEDCFGQYTLESGQFSNHNDPILKIGKCENNLPISIEVAGTINNQIVRKAITLDETSIKQGDRNHEIAWAGNYIQELEYRDFFDYTQRIAEETIEWSINNRVLSVFTAFLALEPELGGYICEECVDETSPTHLVTGTIDGIRLPEANDVELPNITFGAVRDEEWGIPVTDSIVTSTSTADFNSLIFNQISAVPNPFRQGVFILMELTDLQTKQEVNCTIFDLSGKQVKQLIPQRVDNDAEFQIYWDGTDNQHQLLPAGMYIMTVRTSKGLGSLKLVLLE